MKGHITMISTLSRRPLEWLVGRRVGATDCAIIPSWEGKDYLHPRWHYISA